MSLKSTIINPEGHFGPFGGRYLPEMLVPIIDAVRDGFFHYKEHPDFLRELRTLYREYIGRPSPLVYCENISRVYGGAKLYLKNEGLNHTGAHKINHCVGQGILAKRLGKKRIIAETGAGQHGLATASVCARMGLECVIYMGRVDYERQRPNVYAMELAGATVIPVDDGEATLRSAINAALRDLIHHSDTSYYLLGTACGPHPYPSMNVFFQKIIGEEVRSQTLEQIGKLPDILMSCVGGGSNALGLFYDFLDEPHIRMIGVEAGGRGVTSGHHASRFAEKTIGMTQGFKSYFLQTEGGNIAETYSISAGLDYSGVSPQFAYLESIGRVEMTAVTDDQALEALQTCMRLEGLLPALESCHGIAHALTLLPTLSPDTVVVCNMSGRGEKDLFITAPRLDPEWKDFISRTAEKYHGGASEKAKSSPKYISSPVYNPPEKKSHEGMKSDSNPPKTGLMTHLVGLYPDPETSRAIFHTLAKYSEYIEIQIPFSDPIADGTSIAHANEMVRRNHGTAEEVFRFIGSLGIRERRVKTLIMSYYQVLLAYEVESFMSRCKTLGIYGIIIPDIPYDEGDGEALLAIARKNDIHVIATVSPDTPHERLAEIAKRASGFVYAISSNMTTGSSGDFGVGFHEYIAHLREYFSLPIGVGFGVRTREDVERVTEIADFAIIGTELLKQFDQGGIEGLDRYCESLVE